MEGGNPDNPEKNPQSRERTNDKLNPHERLSTGIEPGSQRCDWGERKSIAPQLLSFVKGPLGSERFTSGETGGCRVHYMCMLTL